MVLLMRPHPRLIILIPLCAVWLASCADHAWEVRTYPLGEKVNLGHLTYLGIETQWFPVFGEGPSTRAPQNRFLVVRVSITNGGTSDAAVPNFIVEDNSGHRFAELTDGSGVQDWIGALRTLAPADTLVGNAVFDVPTGHYTLHILDEDSQHEALLDLPLNFQHGPLDSPSLDLRNGPAPGKK